MPVTLLVTKKQRELCVLNDYDYGYSAVVVGSIGSKEKVAVRQQLTGTEITVKTPRYLHRQTD